MSILTVNNDPTERFTSQHAAILKDEKRCDRSYTYEEGGWFCVGGYLGSKRVVHAHCESKKAFEQIMHPEKDWEKRLDLDPYGNRCW